LSGIDGYIFDCWFFGEERVNNEPRDKIGDEVGERSVSGMLDLIDIFEFVIDRFRY